MGSFIARSGVPAAAVIAQLLLCLAPTSSVCQTHIAIVGNSGIAFGAVPRSGTATVTYDAAGAARFTVTGDALRNVRLTVTVVALATTNGASTNSSDRAMTPTVSNADCAFSTDGGESWTTFSSGTLYHDTAFPASPGETASIIVRVGGTVNAAGSQQRGSYAGKITLSASYL